MEEYKDKLRHVIREDIDHILVGPLNWGLGHAARTIPIIKYLISQGITVSVASDGEALQLLKKEFPTLEFHRLPSYNVRYNGTSVWVLAIKNIPNVLKAIFKEYFALKQIAKNKKIDLILSDSRFGFRHSRITSYIITHQLNLQSDNKFMSMVMNFINRKLLNAFDLCIIPDYEDNRLSGDLSISSKIKNKLYIGALSRFKKYELPIIYDKAYILSGPEPARTLLENKIVEKIKLTEEKVILVRGTNSSSELNYMNPNVTILNSVKGDLLNRIIVQSQEVISRSGYTSIMDYYTLGKKAFLIPTPGQPEQEYLAQYINDKYGMNTIGEDSFL